jgi:hypothetical protein
MSDRKMQRSAPFLAWNLDLPIGEKRLHMNPGLERPIRRNYLSSSERGIEGIPENISYCTDPAIRRV